MKTKRPTAKAKTFLPGAVLAAGIATARGTAKGAIGRFTDGEKLRVDEEKLKIVDDLSSRLGSLGGQIDLPQKAVPPGKKRSGARAMADAYQKLEADPSFCLKSRDVQHSAVLDELGISQNQRKHTGWSKANLFNELSRRRRVAKR
jgi:hypothetical protein